MNTSKPFYSQEQIKQIKAVYKITDYLASHGYEPVMFKNGEWYYSSIGIEERTPSFRVNAKKNVYQDYSGNQENTGVCGDIITLVEALENCTFLEACYRLMNSEFMPFVSIPALAEKKADKNPIAIHLVQSIRAKSLIDYIESRRIGFKLADSYLKEVHYTNNDRQYYSLGFKNDFGGYALRSPPVRLIDKGFKGQTTPNGFTTLVPHHETGTCNIFEGFFSMLSCLQHYQRFYFDNRTYVLNSLSNFSKLLPEIPEEITKINLFLDNDGSGRKYVNKLRDLQKWEIKNCAELYLNYKDFNDYLIHHSSY